MENNNIEQAEQKSRRTLLEDPTYIPEDVPEGMTRIKRYPCYWINEQGQVWSALHSKIITPATAKSGGKRLYKSHVLSTHGTNDPKPFRHAQVHRLLAITFIPNPDNHPLVRHLNDESLDNRLENLAWGTYRDNCADARRNGNPVGRKRKFTPRQRAEALRRYEQGEKVESISEAMGLSTNAVYYNIRKAREEAEAKAARNKVRYDN